MNLVADAGHKMKHQLAESQYQCFQTRATKKLNVSIIAYEFWIYD